MPRHDFPSTPSFPDHSFGGPGSYQPPSIPAYEPPEMPSFNPPDISVPSYEMVYECSQCGGEVSQTASTCPHCGVSFSYTTFGGSGMGGGGGRAGGGSSAGALGTVLACTGFMVMCGFFAAAVFGIVFVIRKLSTPSPSIRPSTFQASSIIQPKSNSPFSSGDNFRPRT